MQNISINIIIIIHCQNNYQYIYINKIISKQTMHRERPKSASSTISTYIPNKPKMQTKYKQRVGSRSVLDQSMINDNRSNKKLEIKRQTDNKSVHQQKQKKQRKRSNSVIIQPTTSQFDLFEEPNQFRKTACKLNSQLLKLHHSEQCVCELCTCGRHLCKFHSPALSLPKRSTYQTDYRKKSATPNKVFIASQYPKMDGPNFDPYSTYKSDYPGKNNDDLSRPKPEDNLKSNGPCPNLTSYTSEYPGHKGPNQYVKPTDNHRRQKFPLRGRTTYANTFLGAKPKNDQWQKIQDNLKFGSSWFGESTYNNSFHKPNPQNYAVPVKKKQKLEINPNYKRQFETSYGNNFKNHGNNVCPAKLQLQTRRKGQFKDSKIKFLENSDYKAMPPQYRSFSTSKIN